MKKRIDILLYESGHFTSREKVKRAIMAGEVYHLTSQVTKSSLMIDEQDIKNIIIKSKDSAVSRGYYKLEKALELFNVPVEDRVCIDVGSSTGGFTQCLLEKGAAFVYAVDCGTNQLDYKLRKDNRVVVMEKTNARTLTKELFTELPVLLTMDVSFISVVKIFDAVFKTLDIPFSIILVKPQFEAGKENIGKGGIVRDNHVYKNVLTTVIAEAKKYGRYPAGLSFSPIKGTKGNIEFLLYLIKDQRSEASFNQDLEIDKSINEALKNLD